MCKKLGRPSKYNNTIAKRICDLVATNPLGLLRICQKYNDLPNADTIRLWTREHKDFSLQYARAKSQQAALLAEDILDISDDETRDSKDSVSIARDRLRIDSRKWLASKLVPKIYGDRIAIEDSKDSDEMKTELSKVQSDLKKKHEKSY